jgi:hypothetical protein
VHPSSAVLTALLPLLVLGSSLDLPLPQATGALVMQSQSGLPGTYALVTINGHPLPYAPMDPDRPADAPPPPVVTGSIFTVHADSTFQLSMSYRVTRQGAEQVFERQFHGTYVREGAAYNFTWVNAGQTPVTLRGDTLTLNNVGTLFAYVRQPRP